jgi:hypothetical protein
MSRPSGGMRRLRPGFPGAKRSGLSLCTGSEVRGIQGPRAQRHCATAFDDHVDFSAGLNCHQIEVRGLHGAGVDGRGPQREGLEGNRFPWCAGAQTGWPLGARSSKAALAVQARCADWCDQNPFSSRRPYRGCKHKLVAERQDPAVPLRTPRGVPRRRALRQPRLGMEALPRNPLGGYVVAPARACCRRATTISI